MIRKSTIFKSLTALVMSALSTTAVQAEVLVDVYKRQAKYLMIVVSPLVIF